MITISFKYIVYNNLTRWMDGWMESHIHRHIHMTGDVFTHACDSYPTIAAVGRVFCCAAVGVVADIMESVVPHFSQSYGSFSVIMRSFMLFSNTDIRS